VPRFFFHFVDERSAHLARDVEGAVFADENKAKKEAVGLARDIARHRLAGLVETGNVLVTDEHGNEVLTVGLSGICNRKLRECFDIRRHVAKFGSTLSATIARTACKRSPRARPPPIRTQMGRTRRAYFADVHIVTVWVITMAAIAVAAHIAPKDMLENKSKAYSTASISTTLGFAIAVRFVPQARLSDIEGFLRIYNLTIAEAPRQIGFYRLRAASGKSENEIAALMASIQSENIVELVALQK
jgi:hypothetical protein